MRQVFSSPRLENVEAVARMLELDGIEVRVVNGRSYRGGLRGNFSYRDNADSGPRPSVWIVRSDEQPRARQLLRDAGLLKTSPLADDNFLLPAVQPRGAAADSPWHRASKVRYGLLLLTAALVGLVFAASRRTAGDTTSAAASDTPAAAARLSAARAVKASPVVPAAGSPPPMMVQLPTTTFIVATPPALASMLFARELETAGAAAVCVAIDDADPPAAVLATLRDAGHPASAASDCSAGTAIAVNRYRTDGSGVGTVEVHIRRDGKAAVQHLEVERRGEDWRVLRTL